ncbi:MAG: hypothetical protein SGJ26_15105 [Nitrospirota bacterium]|nr:hypothetical protein [Nitrospirota bacterium]
MAELRATLSKGRSGWCVIFRHPVAKAADGKQKLRVRRGLGTRDDAEAQRLVDQLNRVLGDAEYWSLAAKSKAEASYNPNVVAAFYDHLEPDRQDGWAERERVLPLPTSDDGFARVQFVGTTGAGKTTVVRQFLGTDPATERFPSTSAAKTTIADIEIVMTEGDFKAVVSFIPRNQVRQYIMESVIAAVTALLDGSPSSEVARRFMEHGEQRFRLSYILGSINPQRENGEGLFDEDESESEIAGEAEVTDSERHENAETLRGFLSDIAELAQASRSDFEAAARDFQIDLSKTTKQDRDVLQELVEEQLLQKENFHQVVDAVLDEVESRFDYVTEGELRRGREKWPEVWTYETNHANRSEFIRAVNRFSSNFAPNFGRLLTPIVDGIRVAGPFSPQWSDGEVPKLVLMDAQGIGHTADSTSSISTGITRRFQSADVIVLVDNAAQPMQAAAVAVLSTVVSSGHEGKLVVCFTHFDEVKGDNLMGVEAKKDHVVGSFYNAAQAIGKQSGREAEQALKRLIPERLAFLAKIHQPLRGGAKLTKDQFERMLKMFESSIISPPAPQYHPIYDVANLVLAIQRATQEFHDRWKGLLGMGSRSGVAPEHWTRIKALTRRLGVFKVDEYDSLRPVADLIRLLQAQISSFLSEPLKWNPSPPPENKDAEKAQAIDAIRQEVFRRLHELSTKRVLEERISGWNEAYEHRGTGSTRVRARDIMGLYESAAPVPNEMPGPDTNEFLFELRELVAESVLSNKGELLGWSRDFVEAA